MFLSHFAFAQDPNTGEVKHKVFPGRDNDAKASTPSTTAAASTSDLGATSVSLPEEVQADVSMEDNTEAELNERIAV